MGIVLKGGEIITAYDRYIADIRIEDEKVVGIGKNIACSGDEIIDVKNQYILPGGIDTHTHFDLEVANTVTADDFLSGTKAAIMGGTTTILDFATQNKGESLSIALEKQFQKAKDKAYCDYGFHMGITDWNETTSSEMKEMIEQGVTSFKLYMAYKNTLQVDDATIYQVLQRSKALDGLIAFHCENGDIVDELVQEARNKGLKQPIYHALTRPDSIEKEAIERVLTIAELVDVPIYIVHLSSKKGFQSIVDAKKKGQKVFVETCPQYLLLNDSYYLDADGGKFVMSPPLRKKADNEILWKGCSNGEIQTIGTDHCSFNYKNQKEIGKDDFSKIPNGAPGVEHRLMLLYTYGVLENRMTINDFVALTSTNPAKIFGLYPRKGTIAIGSDADIVVWDPHVDAIITAEKQTQNVDYTPYEGFNQKIKVNHAFIRGKQVIKDYHLNINKPSGVYLHRKTYRGEA